MYFLKNYRQGYPRSEGLSIKSISFLELCYPIDQLIDATRKRLWSYRGKSEPYWNKDMYVNP